VSVGTAEDNDLVLGDPTVSRYHLELRPTPEGIVVRDLGSTNGTWVSGIALRDGTVAPGAQLRLGDTLVVVDAAEAEASASAGVTEHAAVPGMVGASSAMREVAARVRALAPLASSVLVHGETGTGKELVSRALHDLGPRPLGPFVVVDCASLPATLLEGELFGHERGAFTGADRARAGAFERAHGGTVFLDEVGELPPVAQGALLGVLERRRFRRLGGDREISVDVRVVSATNRDLRAEVNRGTFRADLYYRLAGARVVLPPLRERPEDVPPLVAHVAAELTGDPSAIAPDVVATLALQSWPGNVRELRATVERLLALGAAELGEPSVAAPAPPRTQASGEVLGQERYRDAKSRVVLAFEREFVTALLATTGGNVSEAARRAGMDRPYLVSLCRRYGLR
jgi:DNA-binding NtrC family response regulator